MSTKTETPALRAYQIILPKVRISYPAVFAPKVVKGSESGEAKYSATFLINKETQGDLIKMIEGKIAALLKEKNPNGKKLLPDKICLRDGDLKGDTDGYEGCMYLTSSNSTRPSVVDRPSIKDHNGKFVPLDPSDSRFFAGCYVNAAVTLWFQDNANGKRVNGSLDSVQYAGPGERFGTAPTDSNDAFGALEDDGEEDDANL